MCNCKPFFSHTLILHTQLKAVKYRAREVGQTLQQDPLDTHNMMKQWFQELEIKLLPLLMFHCDPLMYNTLLVYYAYILVYYSYIWGSINTLIGTFARCRIITEGLDLYRTLCACV